MVCSTYTAICNKILLGYYASYSSIQKVPCDDVTWKGDFPGFGQQHETFGASVSPMIHQTSSFVMGLVLTVGKDNSYGVVLSKENNVLKTNIMFYFELSIPALILC